ncbi:hypothetical protein METBIDRAFT_10152 [Metschnikowia bicuspidata var. bicuspidata NRRL YB-4993]|uniref:Uncharacterized protein n=1 Tax=Metschnikowia bicuspidata var. bicuspidata NRRL YB-4993 TaxID=869754 RepID=A0A1A0HIW1_9ASCO|nr:hypothetical protein METBIDRAFT_10152 [Metschnikowia bicuspidata var. bicuspidata NRRL YB-4993]OBA23950.1 hypothetical protein METBIDRAFT_10152 [Metschnikowia bicuspidata var. bicuspidata NRRL YB-4993]
MSATGSGGGNFRKRKLEKIKFCLTLLGNLVDDFQLRKSVPNNVVESSKVKQYLNRIEEGDSGQRPACIKMILCDSEADILTPAAQDLLRNDFNVESIYISEASSLSVDRIVTLHGRLSCVSRCALYISFMMNSGANNILKIEPFTLKSQNYQLCVLIEVDDQTIGAVFDDFTSGFIDWSQYERNSGLKIMKLRGDFLSLYKTLCSIFGRFLYQRYISDDRIVTLPVINLHDGDSLKVRSDKDNQKCDEENSNVLKLIYQTSYLKCSKPSVSNQGDGP